MSSHKQDLEHEFFNFCVFFVVARRIWINEQCTNSWQGGKGGGLGEIVGNAVLLAFDKLPASIMFFALVVLCVCWTFGISLKVFSDSF